MAENVARENAVLANLLRRMLIGERQSWSGINDGWMVLDSAVFLTDTEAAIITRVHATGNEHPNLRWCLECGGQGVPHPWDRCGLCGAEQIEPFREGWDESD